MNIYVRNERRLKHYLLYVILMALPVFITKPAYSQWHQTAPQMDVPLTPKTVLVKGDTIFVGMYRGTIYRSTDAGKTWKPSNNGLSWDLYQTYDLLNISDTVFAATTDGVYVSTDFGSHWELRNNGLPYLYNLGINALTNFGNTVYAATPLNGVYKTNNGGKNWVPDNSGLPKNSQNSNENVPINDIIVTDSTIIAATAGIYHKKITQTRWEKSYGGPDRPNSLGAYDSHIFATNGTCSASVYYSEDNGQSWQMVSNSTMNNPNNGCYLPVYTVALNKTQVIVGGDRAIFSSTDNGQHWKTLNTGISVTPGNALFVNDIQSVGNQFYAATFQGLYKMKSGGSFWSLLFSHYPVTPGFSLCSTLGPNILVRASENDYTGTIPEKNYISTDQGNTWKVDTSSVIKKLNHFIPLNGKIYGTGNGFFVTSDFGSHWTEIDTGLPKNNINALAENGSMLFAGYGYVDLGMCPVCGGSYGGVYRSNNGGQSWTLMGLKGSPVNSLVSVNGNIIAQIRMSQDLYISKNYGQTWSRISNLQLPSGTNLTDMVTTDGVIYLGSAHGVYISEDGGNSWNIFNSGLPKDTTGSYPYVSSMYVNHTNPSLKGTVFIILNNKLFAYQKGQKSWIPVHAGLSENENRISDITADNNFLYAATDNGMWKLSLSSIPFIQSIGNSGYPHVITLFKNYPNPFNPSTTISYKLASSEHVRLTIYDILGQQVTTLINKNQQKGNHEVTFHANQLSSGVYLYEIKVGNNTYMKKMLLLK